VSGAQGPDAVRDELALMFCKRMGTKVKRAKEELEEIHIQVNAALSRGHTSIETLHLGRGRLARLAGTRSNQHQHGEDTGYLRHIRNLAQHSVAVCDRAYATTADGIGTSARRMTVTPTANLACLIFAGSRIG
jgi:hypothetical protein